MLTVSERKDALSALWNQRDSASQFIEKVRVVLTADPARSDPIPEEEGPKGGGRESARCCGYVYGWCVVFFQLQLDT